jgi:hypothetical protein
VLIPCSEADALDAISNKDKQITVEQVGEALKELAPNGKTVGTTLLAKKLVEITGKKVEAVKKSLQRNGDTRFAKFKAGDSIWTAEQSAYRPESFMDSLDNIGDRTLKDSMFI